MLYKHKVTGAVVETESQVGGNWEPVTKKEEKKAANDTKSTKGKAKK